MGLIKKLLGIDKLEENVNAAKAAAEAAERSLEETKQAKEAEIAELQKQLEETQIENMSPKERATLKKEPWVGVIDTHVNKDNIRNGFFELDWNDEFVTLLKRDGYGTDGDNPEDIVDRWFRELCANVVVDGGYDTFGQIIAGSLNGASINKSKETD